MVITAGPTHEPIDPVRYIANRSSGRQGYALAEAARDAGAEVVLISGPVHLPAPPNVRRVCVETAREMAQAVEAALPCDIFIAAAAVADWRAGDGRRPENQEGRERPARAENDRKSRHSGACRRGARDKRPGIVVGFAAETEKLVEHARAKLARKGCDLIVANDVGAGSEVMGGSENTLVLVTASGEQHWPKLSKQQAATRLIAHIAQLCAAQGD